MVLPFWSDLAAGVFDIATVLVVIVLAHLIAKAKGVGGMSMVICIYISIFAVIFSTIISVEASTINSKTAYLVFSLEVVSSFFAFLASIHALRFVRASHS